MFEKQLPELVIVKRKYSSNVIAKVITNVKGEKKNEIFLMPALHKKDGDRLAEIVMEALKCWSDER